MDDLVRTALDAAEAAAEIQRSHHARRDVTGATDKGISDFVSETDLEAQAAALAVIRSRHPDHRILAEEDEEEEDDVGTAGPATKGEGPDGSSAGEASGKEPHLGPLWVVDPVDGTTNFLHGHPMYCASVGLWDGGRAVAGAVVAPATGERWWAGRGEGAWKDGEPIRVSELKGLERALIGTGFPFKIPDRIPLYLRQLERVLRATAGVRRGGSAALDLCYVAQGTFDAFWELHLQPWDVAAGVAILEEAGGRATRLDGSPLDLETGSVLAAASPELLEALGELVRGAGD